MKELSVVKWHRCLTTLFFQYSIFSLLSTGPCFALVAENIGQPDKHFDFEDEKLPPYKSYKMSVPPVIISEDGENKFLRITGSKEDRDALPVGKHLDRNRSTLDVTIKHNQMPVINDFNKRQYYSADMRFNDISDKADANIMELFQWADKETESYAKKNGIGPVARFKYTNGHVYLENYYLNETKVHWYDLGSIMQGRWHNYALRVLWTHDANEGLIEIYLDGKLKYTVSDRATNLGNHSNRLPMLKFGLYGDNATGTLDVDNISIKSWESDLVNNGNK